MLSRSTVTGIPRRLTLELSGPLCTRVLYRDPAYRNDPTAIPRERMDGGSVSNFQSLFEKYFIHFPEQPAGQLESRDV